MTTTQKRCERCGYTVTACTCAKPLTPVQAPRPPGDNTPLLTPSEVGRLFRVDPKTVTRWAQQGKLPSIRTLGGHRRYREDDVHALLNGGRS